MIGNTPGKNQMTPRLDTMIMPNGKFMLIVSNAGDLNPDEIRQGLLSVADKVGAAAVLVTPGPLTVGGAA